MADAHPSAQQLRERVATELLKELRAGVEDWYYISLVHAPTNTFRHGCFLKATGPTHAWVLLHALNLADPDCETATMGPIRADKMTRVPEAMRWVKLSREQVASI
jgi:hypothetical protein